MGKKTILIIAAVCVGGCCFFGAGVLVLGAAAANDDAPAAAVTTTTTTSAGGTGGTLGGYIIYGRSTPIAAGYGESLIGDWMLMDGASVESIEAIHSDRIEVKTSRTGELFHYSFAEDGSYAFRYLITSRMGKALWVEKGEWTSDGTNLTLTPGSCTT